MTKNRRATTNSSYPKGGVSCSKDSFVVVESFVFRINICGLNCHLRQAAKRTMNCKIITIVLFSLIFSSNLLGKEVEGFWFVDYIDYEYITRSKHIQDSIANLFEKEDEKIRKIIDAKPIRPFNKDYFDKLNDFFALEIRENNSAHLIPLHSSLVVLKWENLVTKYRFYNDDVEFFISIVDSNKILISSGLKGDNFKTIGMRRLIKNSFSESDLLKIENILLMKKRWTRIIDNDTLITEYFPSYCTAKEDIGAKNDTVLWNFKYINNNIFIVHGEAGKINSYSLLIKSYNEMFIDVIVLFPLEPILISNYLTPKYPEVTLTCPNTK